MKTKAMQGAEFNAPTPKPEEVIEQKAQPVLVEVRELAIVDTHGLQCASDLLGTIKALRAEVADTFDGPIAAAHKAHKEICAAKRKHDNPLEAAEMLVKSKMSQFTFAQEQERRRLQAEAEAKAQAEAQAIRDAEIAAARKAKDKEAAKALKAAPLPVVPVYVPPPPPKVEGMRTVTEWHWEVQDKTLVPVDYMTLDTRKLDAVVKAMKGESRIPGIRVFSTHRTDAAR